MEFRNFYVRPKIPKKLMPLYNMSFNVWATWDKDAGRLYRRMDAHCYQRVQKNPVALFHEMDTQKLIDLSEDNGFLYEMEKVYEKFTQYMGFRSTYEKNESKASLLGRKDVIAYLSMEYGLHESLPLYSGGLGVLSGDHLKAASDIGFPMVGVGLLYKYGYFSQKINHQGYQEEKYKENNWFLKPIREVKDDKGKSLKFKMKIKDFDLHVKIWCIDVGKVPLYLLDTNLPENSVYARGITDHLYVSDRKRRLEQEILLGVGSQIALSLLTIEPRIYHLNEGHSAFLIIERMRELIQKKKMSFEVAKQYVRYTTVFTTHTPVVEGNEHFEINLIKEYLTRDIEALGVSVDEFLKYGRIDGSNYFWLPAFAVVFSRFSNGVSKLHGEVSRSMWKALYPMLDPREVPIDYVTNGVHLLTWLSTEITYLFDRYVGPDYIHKAQQGRIWKKIASMPDTEVWEAHKRTKNQLISYVREKRVEALQESGASIKQIGEARKVLNPEYLTIGFARRFASYKRANLILQDKERLVRILKDPHKPVQFVFAGKAHPADGTGKNLIKEIIEFGRKYGVEDRFIFIEDYSIEVAQYLVQGVDVWLNTPIKPLEASGTSGMKAGMNGVLNLSVPDGWWPECYDGMNGWSINAGEGYDNLDMRRVVEANQIYDLIEDEITEIYYSYSGNGYSEEWVKRMKHAIATVGKDFNMHRMLRDYYRQFYRPEITDLAKVESDNYAFLKDLSSKLKSLKAVWSEVYVKDVISDLGSADLTAGNEVNSDVYVHLGSCQEQQVTVELLYRVSENTIKTEELKFVEQYQDKIAKYQGFISLSGHGVQGLNVRIRPKCDAIYHAYPGLVKYFY
ncbi:MAG: alpha-glucan phosphorylase [Acidobacteria bacterium]|nr:MAG: alpha-glucan phosphorylase [Acidobacteriota bacterium]